jgi:DNA-binding IclR family transcriptional regulator
MTASDANSSSAARVLGILEEIIRAESPPRQSELARRLGMPKTTVSDVLADLCDLGYAESIAKGYVPGPALRSFASAVAEWADLRLRLRPTLESLTAQTRETTLLAIEQYHGQGPAKEWTVIDFVEGRYELRVVPQRRSHPIFPTAVGLVFLAFSGRTSRDIDPTLFIPHTSKTILDPRKIDAELKRVNSRGYAVVFDQVRDGHGAYAVPVFGRDGAVVAAITLTGPSPRLRQARQTIVPALLAASHAAAGSARRPSPEPGIAP